MGQFIIDELRGHAVEVAQTRCGCRVLERLLKYCQGSQVSWLVEGMLIQPLDHCKNPFANFVMQHIFSHGSEEDHNRLVGAMVTDVFQLARHRVANHVVRCAFTHSCERNKERIAELLRADSKALAELRYHPYGSFIFRELRRGSN